MKRLLGDSLLATILVFIVLGLFPRLFDFDFFIPFKETLADFQITDINFSKVLDTEVVTADTNIVIIDIEKLNKLQLASVITAVSEKNPRVIGISKVIEKSDNEFHDMALAEAIKNAGNIVLSYKMAGCNYENLVCDSLQNDNLLASEDAVYGFNNLLIGKDKKHTTVRNFHPKAQLRDSTVYSFACQVASLYDNESAQNLLARNNKDEIIDYRGDFSKYPFIEGRSVLTDDISNDFFRDKIVLMGIVGAFRGYDLLEKLYFTPLNERYAGRTFPDLSGVEIQANIVSTIREGNYYSRMPVWLGILLAALITYIDMFIFSLICTRNVKWFEISSLLIFVIESITILYLTVIMFQTAKYEIRMTEAIFAIAVSIFAYQIYNESLKPTILRTYNRFTKRKGKL